MIRSNSQSSIVLKQIRSATNKQKKKDEFIHFELILKQHDLFRHTDWMMNIRAFEGSRPRNSVGVRPSGILTAHKKKKRNWLFLRPGQPRIQSGDPNTYFWNVTRSRMRAQSFLWRHRNVMLIVSALIGLTMPKQRDSFKDEILFERDVGLKYTARFVWVL